MPIEWQIQTLRLTGFNNRITAGFQQDWWRTLFGQPPDERISKPKTIGFREESEFNGAKLTLTLQLGRVDWLMSAILSEEDDQTIPSFGPFPEAQVGFSDLMVRWFKIAPPFQRIAFGAILIGPVGDGPEGYRKLIEYLKPVTLDPMNSSDFFYQINRPRMSGIMDGLKINRLSKWGVMSWKQSEISMGPGKMQYNPGHDSFACALELDISTAAGNQGEFPPELSGRIFDELTILGKEIALQGDIR